MNCCENTPKQSDTYLRVSVERCEGDLLYLQDGKGKEMTLDCSKNNGTEDWSSLKKIAVPGSRLNLVLPQFNGEMCLPELVVFEPDCLINITTVARCFTNYADSPLVDLLKKIEPPSMSEAITLGNFAGKILDETMHQYPKSIDYRQSVKDFFSENTINLITTDISSNFHNEAQRQKVNIEKAIGSTMPAMIKDFDLKEGIVEPSFFSEMLGLQGRMDYLQMDFKLLMEQKSGKGAFPYDDFITPSSTIEHRIQLMLYMLLIKYNFHDIYEDNKHELNAFLLYSKYRESLLRIDLDRKMILEAMRIRNGLAWCEMQYTKPDGFRVLERLTADKINLKKVDNSLWLNYQKPQIEELLGEIGKATDLEKRYYFRLLTFIANEHMLSKTGSDGFASSWNSSLEEKLANGTIYDRLSLQWPIERVNGHIEKVVLSFTEKADNDMSNFRTGDIVILYYYSKEDIPDLRHSIAIRCTIEAIEESTITLSLRAPQSDARIFQRNADKLWAIEHDFMESSYTHLYKGVHSFLRADKSRRDLLMLQREPKHDDHRMPKGKYGEFDFLIQHVKQADDFFLIIGPPGTGKTSFGMLYTVKEELMEPDASILLAAYTNRAVDEICSKLKEEKIDFVRLGSPYSCSPQYRENLLSQKVKSCDNVDQARNLLEKTKVIVGTTTSFNSSIALFKLKRFSLAVIDEASQILESHIIGMLCANHDGTPAIKKFVMIGDHKQLPAVVRQGVDVSTVNDSILNAIGLDNCRISLFERLLKHYHNNPAVSYMLCRQGRMHHDIALLPNTFFYNGELTELPFPRQHLALPLPTTDRLSLEVIPMAKRLAFIDVATPKESPSEKVNINEAVVIAKMVEAIYNYEGENFECDKTVGVIVPYRNQISTIRNLLETNLRDITIDTVERFQGSQRKYIIYGFTVQNIQQLDFLTDNTFVDTDGTVVDRKLNVATTRAQEHLILVGNAELLSRNELFAKVIDFISVSNARI